MKKTSARNEPQTPLERHVLAVSHEAITEAKRLELRMQRRHMYAALFILGLVCLAVIVW